MTKCYFKESATMNTHKSPTLIIALLCLITSTGRFVMDSYLPSIPAIAENLGVSGNDIELTLTLYLLGFGTSQLFYGPLSDKYGRKPILIGGFILFLLANSMCFLAQSLPILLIARLLSGIGMGASGVLNRAIASDCFTGTAFSKAWSYTTTTVVFVLIIAPLIGCEIQTLWGWRANFILINAYILCVFIIIYCKLPETLHSHSAKISVKHALKNYKTILSNYSFLSGTLCYTLAFAGLIAYFQVSSLLLMKTLGLSSLSYGYVSLLIALCYMAGGLIVNRFASSIGTEGLLKIGIFLIILSALWMVLWNQSREPRLISIILPVALYVIGARIVIPNSIANSFAELRHLSGSTSGMLGFIQMLGSSIISFIVSGFNFESPLLLGIVFSIVGISMLGIIGWPIISQKYSQFVVTQLNR